MKYAEYLMAAGLWLMAGTPASGMELQEAFADPRLTVEIAGTDFSLPDAGDRDITIRVWNRGNEPVTVSAGEGFVITPEDDAYQDMILTEPVELLVNAGESSHTGVHALCIQAADRSPAAGTRYAPSGYADGPLRLLAGFLFRNQLQDISGQEAMWALSDNHSVYDIGGRADRINTLRQFVADLKGEAFDSTRLNPDKEYVDRHIKEYALFLKFYLNQRDDIRLQLFNHKGEWERDLMHYASSQPGRYDMQYKVSLSGLLGEKYFVRLYVGDEMRTEFTLYIKDS